jgi:RND family efflux transporter MFP subunit
MKRLTKSLLIVVALLAAGLGGYQYFYREEPEKVTVITPSRATIEEAFTATGAVEALRTVRVTTEPGARFAAIYFREHDYVRKDQLLAKLDQSELRAQVDQIHANLTLAESNLANAEINLQRTRRLYEKGFAARQEVESTERQMDLYRSQIVDRKAAIAQVEARLARTSIVAPISGIVTKKFVEVGGIVPDSDARAPGQTPQTTAVAELTELGSTEFHADVDQADIVKVRVGQPATLQMDALPQRVLQATTREIAVASTPDPTGRVRYSVKLRVSSAEEILKVGMTGSAKFVSARKRGVLALPVSVILQHGNEEVVYVVQDGRAVMKTIKTGLQGDDMVEVVSGLNPQDLVIDQGRAKLKTGRRVEPVDAKR